MHLPLKTTLARLLLALQLVTLLPQDAFAFSSGPSAKSAAPLSSLQLSASKRVIQRLEATLISAPAFKARDIMTGPTSVSKAQVLTFVDGRISWQDPIALLSNTYAHQSGVGRKSFSDSESRRFSGGGGGGATSSSSTSTTTIVSGLSSSDADSAYVNVSGDTMVGALSINYNGLGLIIRGTASGNTLHAERLLTVTGSAIFDGNARFNSTLTLNSVTYTFPSSDGSASGKVLKTDGAGHLSWSDDTGSSTDLSVSAGDARYVRRSGSTMTGALVISLTSGFLGLRLLNTASGNILHSEKDLTSSGTLTVTSTARFKSNLNTVGTLSGAALTIMNGTSYALGSFGIGTSSPKAKLDVAGTISGSNLIISRNGSFSGSLTVLSTLLTKGTLSGANLTISNSASISGSLLVKTSITSKGSLSGATIAGFNLGSCNASTQKLLYNNSTSKFECSTDAISTFGTGNVLTLNGNKVSKSGDTMTGALVINLTSGFLGLRLLSTASGNILHAEKDLTSSGTLTVTSTARFKSNLNTVGTLSGAALTIMSGTSYALGSFGIGTSSPKAKLDVSGTISGSNLIISQNGSFSGSLRVQRSLSGSSFFGAGLGDCGDSTISKLIYNNATGKFDCALDQTFGIGLSQSAGDARYVNTSGDAMTGALVINLTSGFLGLKLLNTASGNILHAEKDLTSSGTLTVTSTARFKSNLNTVGTLSGAALTIMNGTSYALGSFGIGTSSPKAKLEVSGTISGSRLFVASAFSGAGLTTCSSTNQKLLWNASTQQFTCSTDLTNTFGTGNVLTLGAQKYVSKQGDTMTGALVISLTSGFLGLRLLSTASGNILHAEKDLTSSGTLTVTSTARFKSNLNTVGTLSGAALTIMNGTSYALGSFGIGTSSPKAKLDVSGTISGSNLIISRNGSFSGSLTVLSTLLTKGTLSGANLTVSNSASISGSLLVKTSITSKGSLSGATISGFNLGSCSSSTKKLLFNNSTNKFECGSDLNAGTFGTGNVITINGNKVSKSGDTMTGALVINLTSGFLGLRLLNTASGNILHAEKDLTSSGTLTITSTARFKSNLNTVGTLSGAALTIMSGTSYALGSFGIGTSSPKAKLDVSGTISGSNLIISQNGSFSGSLIVKNSLSGSSFFGAGLGNCNNATTSKLIYNNATGKFVCATDQDNGVGLTQSAGDARYVNTSGDAMTGALVINLTSGFLGLRLLNTASGNVLHAEKDLTSSGTLTVTSTARFKSNLNAIGTLSGAALTLMSGTSYALGSFGIGTSSPKAKLEVIGTLSGSRLFVASAFSGAGLTTCSIPSQKLLWNASTQQFSCGTDLNSTFGTGNVLTLGAQKYVSKQGDTMTGALVINLTSGFLGLRLLNTASGNVLHAEKDLTSSGTLTVTSTARFKSNLNAVGTLSGTALTIMNGTSYALGSFGIGTSSPKAKLDVLGTISGSTLIISSNGSFSGSLTVVSNIITKGTLSGANLTVSNSASISGSLLVKTSITSKGSLSGVTISGFSLGSCNGSTQKLLFNNATGKFACGTDLTDGSGSIIAVGDSRYVKKQGDTMTGALVINLTSGFLGLRLINTMSGNIVHAEKSLSSSGTIIAGTDLLAKGTIKSHGFVFNSGALLLEQAGMAEYVNVLHSGLGTASVQRLTSQGNLVNIGSIQAGEIHARRGGTFLGATDYTTGSLPKQVAVGDLNGDGRPDLVVTNNGATSMSVFLATTGNVFLSAADYTTGSTPIGVAIGDLNGDGSSDVAVVNNGSATVSVFLNYGNGTFAPKADLTTGTTPESVAIGDFNGDGKGDLVVTNNGSTNVSVFLNIGNAKFAAATNYATANNPDSVAVADVNGDSKADLVVANNGSTSVSVFLNTGGGAFAAKTDYLTANNPNSVALGDLNGDGAPDIAVSDNGSAKVSVLLNTGNGTFATKADYSTGTTPNSVAIADVNGDGRGDLLVSNNGSTSVSVLLNKGNGTFAARTDFTTGSAPTSVAAGDFNTDGKMDIVVVNNGGNSVSTLFNDSKTILFVGTGTGGAVGIGTSTPGSALSVSGGVIINRSGNLANGSADAGIALEVIGMSSGRVLHAQDMLQSSGSLIVEGTISGATLRGAGLGSCNNPASQKLLYNNTTNKFECGAATLNTFGSGNVLTIGNARYVSKQGDTMTGALTINLSSGFIGLKIINTASGNILHAEKDLTSSGTLTVSSTARFKSNVNVVGTVSGAALTVMNGTSYLLGNLGIGTTAPKAKLDIAGTISGANLVVSNNASFSGALTVVGSLVSRGTLSGQSLIVSRSASISGTLLVKTSITSKGSLSGSTIAGFSLGSCNNAISSKLLYNNSTSKFECGTDAGSSSFGTGNVITVGDSRYVKKQGDTMTGALIIDLSSGFLGLRILQTASGNVIHAEKTLSSSGLLMVTQRTVQGSGALVVEQLSNSTGAYITSTATGAALLVLDSATGSLKAPHILFGYMGRFDVALYRTSGSVLNLSGHLLPASTNRYDLGSSSKRWRSLYLSGGTLYLGQTGNQSSINYNTSASRFGIDANADGTNELSILSSGNVGIGTAAPKAKLDVAGTLSGINLTVSRSASISGTLLVKSSITSKGSLSGVTIAGFNLGSCNNATTSKLLYNNGTGKFECGTDQSSTSTFGTGNVVTITDGRYVKKTGDTMTGTLKSRGFLLASGTTLAEMSGFNEYLNLPHSGLGTNSVTRLTKNGDLVNIGTIQAGEANFRRGGTFADKVDYTTGSVPYSVSIGDLNGDGKPDLAVANSISDSVSVFLNNGNGTFASKVDYTTGTNPRSVSIGDLNGDGKPDLAVTNYDSNSVSVFLNMGSGTFASKVDYTTGTNPYSVSIGDLSGDGKPDLAVANYNSSTVSVFLNNGNGTFASKVDYTTGTNPYSVSIGDLNGDGKPDLAVANQLSDTVSVFLNNGNGTFASKVDYTTGSNPISVAIGDLNGDGKSDLAVTNNGSNTVSVFLNNGNGTFASKVDYTTGSNPISVAIGDLNGDGKSDLAVTNNGSTSVSIFLGSGNGTFASKVDYTTGGNPHSVAIGDLSGDGKSDLAVANTSADTVSVLFNNSRTILYASAGTGGAVGIGTSTPGSALAVSGAVLINRNGNIANSAADIGLALEVIGVMSGRVLHAQDMLRSSGSLIVEGTISGALLRGAGLGSCNGSLQKLLYNNSTNKFECGTDLTASSSFGTGNVLTITSARYVSKQGDTMTGALTINLTSGFLGLKVVQTASGNILHAEKDLTSSGTLTVNGTARFKGNVNAVGTLSGAALTIMNGNSYLLGSVGIGTTSPKAKLDVIGTVSGTTLVISQNGSFSGSLIVKRNISGSSLFGAGLGDCNNSSSSKLIYNNATGKFGCATDQTIGSGLSYSSAEGIFVNQRGDTMTGALTINLTSGFLGLKVLQTASGNILHAEKQLSSSGTIIAVNDILSRNGTAKTKGFVLFSGATLSEMSGFNESVNLIHSGLATNTITRLTNQGDLVNIGTIQSGEAHFRRGGTFLPKVDYTTGTTPYSVAIGDLNGDAKMDMVVVNEPVGTISVFIGTGSGLFVAKVDYTAGGSPRSVAIGDLNGDGKPDLAIANGGVTSVSILMNNGNGTFATKVDYTTGIAPYSVAIGDLNGDAKPDLAVANQGSTSVSIFLNNGNGTFASKVDYTTGTTPLSVAIGDLNGDGKSDVAVANSNSDSISIFLNNGNGTFATKVDYTTGIAPYSVAIGDLNGDAKPDLAVANQGSTSVSIFLNNGNGTFASKVDYTTGSSPRFVAIGDLNGDGKSDVAVANSNSDSISIFLNNGNGTFATKVDYTTGTTPLSVAIGDLNGDGRRDIAVANYGTGINTVSILLNDSRTILYASAGTGGAVGIGTSTPGSALAVSGAVLINRNGNILNTSADVGLALEVIGTMSGRILHAQDLLRSSGSVIVEGTISGALLRGAGLGSCNSTTQKLLYNNTSFKFECGTDLLGSFGTGNVLIIGDNRYVNTSGDTMTGALTINLTSGFLGLKILNTASGNILHAEKQLSSSGTIIAVNDILSRNGTAKTKGFVLFSGATLSEMSGFAESVNLIHSGLATNTITRLTNQGDLVNIGTIQSGEAHFRRGGTFLPKVDYTTGTTPYSVAIGDLNGDGKSDLAVANYSSTSVSIFLNNGNGTFASKVDYTTGTQPNSVSIGDLNGDGKSDLAVANYGSTSVSIFLNNGNGTFASKVDYTTGTTPYSVSIGDLSGDGKPDLAVANAGSTSVSVLLNNGNGTFASKVDYTTGSVPASVSIGDLSGDGKPDLAVANASSTTVSVFINNGNGTFASKVDYTTGSIPVSVAIGDLSGDGKSDLAVANYGSTSVSIFLNNGNGTFASKVDYTTGSSPNSVSIGDLSGDGKSDLAVANYGSTSVSVLLNNGNGTFAARVDYTAGTQPYSVAIGDLDGDGKSDLAVANAGSTSVSVFLNNSRTILYASAGTGGAVGIGTSTPGSALAVSGAVLINRNGNILNTSADVGLALEVIGTMSGRILHAQDLLRSSGSVIVEGTISGALLRGAGLGSCNGTTQKLLYNNTSFKFECGTDLLGSFGTGNVLIIGDNRYVNTSGDTMTGALTINLTSGSLGLKILNTASGNIIHAEKNLTSSGTIIAVNDILSRNGTAKTKGYVLFSGATLSEMSGFNESVNLIHSGLATNTITRLTNQGDLVNIGTIQSGEAHFRRGGTFATKVDYTTAFAPISVAIGDLNGDSKADLAVANNNSNSVSVFLNNGNGTFASKVDYTTGTNPHIVSIGDLNGDGNPDLAVANYNSNSVSVFLNNGNGTFASKVDYTTGTHPYSVSIGDLSGDGKPDLAVTNFGSTSVSVFLNNGNGTFASKVDYTTGSSPESVSIGDLSGDGKPDLAVANRDSNTVSVFLNNGNGTFASKVDYTTGSSPESVAIGDLNGDGKSDLAVANNNSNSVSVFLNNGNGTFASKVDYTTGSSPESVSIGDLSGDGKPDLAVANYGSDTVSVFLNNGNGTYATKVDYTTGTNPYSVSIGDLNGDGKADLATANSGSSSVSVFLNNSRTILYASAGTGGAVGIGTSTPGSILAVSGAVLINRNGNILNTSADVGLSLEVIGTMSGRILHAQDLLRSSGSVIVEGTISGALLRGAGLGSCNSSLQKLLYNNTSFKFECGTDLLGSFGTGNVLIIGDNRYVNTSGDTMTGALTINLTSGFLGLKVLNTASGNILHAEKQLSSSGTIIAVNDILSRNGTAKTKGFVLFSGATLSEMSGFNESVNLIHSGLATNTVTRLTNQGDLVNIGTIQSGEAHFRRGGTFLPKTDYTTGTNPYAVAAGDLNGDGKSDLVVANINSDSLSVFIGTGSGLFVAKFDYTTGSRPTSVSIGDLNGDGKSDLAVTNYTSNSVSILLNNGNGTFASKVDYTTGSLPWSVAINDLNGDGKPDLAVANNTSSTVSIFLNLGNGTFASKVDYTTGSGPYSVSIGDLSGDGKADLAVANQSSNSVSVFLNNGNGTFASRVDYTTGTTPWSVAINDLNGDGKADLAVANQGGTVSVFLNNGNGTFATKVDYATASGSTWVAIGDVNGDGKPDLAVANETSNSVSILLNNGNGTFATKVDYTTGSAPHSIAIGDLNGDGKADLAVANYSSNTVSVLLNNARTILYASSGTGGAVGIGTSTPGSALAVSGAVLINRNGNILNTSADVGLALEVIGTMSGRILHAQDLLRSSGSVIVEGTISGALLRGAGLGSCNSTTQKLLYNNTSFKFECGTDLLGSFGTGNVMTIGDARYVNTSGDTMTGALTINLTSGFLGLKVLNTASGNILHAEKQLSSSGTIIAVNDILSRNGTAKTKGFVLFSGATLSEMSGFNESVNLIHSGLATNSITRLTNQGDLVNIGTIQSGEAHFRRGGTFLPKTDYTTGSLPNFVSMGDLNGDGKADLVVVNQTSSTVSVFLNNSNGTFASKVDYTTGSSPRSVSIGDLNGDGKVDLAVANANDSTVSVFLNNSNGTFASKVDYTTGTSPYSVSIGDLNGDGKADLAVTNIGIGVKTVSVLLNNGNGTFALKVDYATGTNPYPVVIGDLNGDGKEDLAVANADDSTVSILLNNGNGTFSTKVDYTTGSSPRSVSIGDLNGDGKADLAVVNGSDSTVSILLNNGNGTFATKVDYTTSTIPQSVSMGDMNGDGKADLAVVGSSENVVSIFLNNGNGTFAARVIYATGTNPISVSIGDLNGDGKADLAVANSSNSVSVLLNDSRTILYASAGTGGAVGIGTSTPGSALAVSGAVLINRNGNIANSAADVGLALEVIGTMSGRILHANDLLRSSGSLAIEGASYFGSGVTIRTTHTSAGASEFTIITDYTSTSNKVFRVSASGAVYADGRYNSAGADYAEWFQTSRSGASSDRPLEPGEVVCIDVTQNNTVKRCERSADPNLMGIVSTHPAFVGNVVSGADGVIPPGYALIGLIGQVPAMASLENGPIRAGDSVTSAETPGYIRRANAGESTVGVALEAFDGVTADGSRLINVLISRRNQSPTVELVEQKVLDSIKAMDITEQINKLVSSVSQNLNLDDRVTQALNTQLQAFDLESEVNRLVDLRLASLNLTSSSAVLTFANSLTGSFFQSLAKAVASELSSPTTDVDTASISTGNEVRMKNDESRISHLESVLSATGGVVRFASGTTLHAAALDLSSGATIRGNLHLSGALIISDNFSLLSVHYSLLTISGTGVQIGSLMASGSLKVIGPITITGLATFLGDVQIKGQLILSNKQAGFAVIPKTGTSVIVHFPLPMVGTPIVTATADVPVGYAVTKTSATGFTLRIAEPATEDITFSFIALSADQPFTTVAGSHATATASLIPFPVNIFGQPVSSDPLWNGCIAGHPVLNSDGVPFSCSRYHSSYAWDHPDLHISFLYNPNHDPAILTLPEGYIVVIVSSDGTTTPVTPAEETPIVETPPSSSTGSGLLDASSGSTVSVDSQTGAIIPSSVSGSRGETGSSVITFFGATTLESSPESGDGAETTLSGTGTALSGTGVTQ